jgi:hypothetical protein
LDFTSEILHRICPDSSFSFSANEEETKIDKDWQKNVAKKSKVTSLSLIDSEIIGLQNLINAVGKTYL